MKTRFSDQTISLILQQSTAYTCACPAQICKAINEQRRLFQYQAKCLNLTDTDKAVHQLIANTSEITHAELENCLEQVLILEGWNMETYQMPESLKQKLWCEFENTLNSPT